MLLILAALGHAPSLGSESLIVRGWDSPRRSRLIGVQVTRFFVGRAHRLIEDALLLLEGDILPIREGVLLGQWHGLSVVS